MSVGLPGAAGVVAGLLLAGYAWHRWRLARAAGEVAQDELETARLAEILQASPDGYYCWSYGAEGEVIEEVCSRRLAVLLNLYGGTGSTYVDLLDSFGSAEAAVLEVAVAALRQSGTGFELELGLHDQNRRVMVQGIRAAAHDGEALADVLWMRDVTEGTTAMRRLMEQSILLTEERDRLRGLLDALPFPVWVRDGDLALRYCNRPYAEAVDAEAPEDAVERGAELTAGAAMRQARALAARARAAQAARSELFHLVLKGSRRLAEISEAPFVAGARSGTLTAGIALDHTAREELQNELARHVSAHAEVLENLATAIAIFSTDTRLTFFNTAFTRLWRLEPDWLASQPTYGSVLDALRDRRRLPEVADYRAFKDEELRRFTSLIDAVEDLLHLPDETTLRRVITAHPFGGLLFTYEDVTDTLALERSYNTSIAVQRETLDHLHEGVAVFGADGRLRLWNPAYGEVWQLAPEELAGEPHMGDLVDLHAGFFTPAEWPPIRESLIGLVGGRVPRQGRIDRADGAILDYASVPLPDGAVLLTWLDVSDSAHVERALRERNDALSAADRLKSEFIANVSVEVRTPLNTIIGFSEILTNAYYGKLNKRQAEYAAGITEAGQTLQVLVSDILDLATIEAGQMTLELNTVDVHAMITAVLGLVRERTRDARLTINFDCPLDIGWMVGDERRLKQVMFNLISNAVKFTPPGGSIIVAAQRDGDDMVFTVADTGTGISEAEQARMFQSFARGNRPEARQGGAGLGLTLVKSFVELHGGQVEIVSVADEGTTVTCRIPAGQVDELD